MELSSSINPRVFHILFHFQFSTIFVVAQVWEMYKKHEASFWTAEEIDLAQDNKDWLKLTEGEQHFVKHVPRISAAKLFC